MKLGFFITISVLIFASQLKACDFSSFDPFPVSLLSAPVVSFPKPNYPPAAKEQKLEGKVQIKVLINRRSGEVEQACLVEGHKILSPAAIKAALKAKFWQKWTNQKAFPRKYKYLQGVLSYDFVVN